MPLRRTRSFTQAVPDPEDILRAANRLRRAQQRPLPPHMSSASRFGSSVPDVNVLEADEAEQIQNQSSSSSSRTTGTPSATPAPRRYPASTPSESPSSSSSSSRTTAHPRTPSTNPFRHHVVPRAVQSAPIRTPSSYVPPSVLHSAFIEEIASMNQVSLNAAPPPFFQSSQHDRTPSDPTYPGTPSMPATPTMSGSFPSGASSSDSLPHGHWPGWPHGPPAPPPFGSNASWNTLARDQFYHNVVDDYNHPSGGFPGGPPSGPPGGGYPGGPPGPLVPLVAVGPAKPALPVSVLPVLVSLGSRTSSNNLPNPTTR